MTDFPTAALTAAVQVTLAIIPSMFLVLLIGRRRATASATLSVSALVVAAGLTVAAWTPLPGGWSWAGDGHDYSSEVASQSPDVVSARGSGPVWDVASLLKLLNSAAPAAERTTWSWRTVAAIGIGVCAAVSL